MQEQLSGLTDGPASAFCLIPPLLVLATGPTCPTVTTGVGAVEGPDPFAIFALSDSLSLIGPAGLGAALILRRLWRPLCAPLDLLRGGRVTRRGGLVGWRSLEDAMGSCGNETGRKKGK